MAGTFIIQYISFDFIFKPSKSDGIKLQIDFSPIFTYTGKKFGSGPGINEIRGKENRLLFNPAKKPEGLDESEENKSKKTED